MMKREGGKGEDIKGTGRHVKGFGFNSIGGCLQNLGQITLEP